MAKKSPTDIFDSETLRQMAADFDAFLQEEHGEKLGFAILLFTFGEEGNLQYISNADRTDMIAMMREFLQRQALTGKVFN